MIREWVVVSKGNPVERKVPRKSRRRRFGARNDLGSTGFVSSSGIVVDKSERVSSLGKGASIRGIHLSKVVAGAWRTMRRMRSRCWIARSTSVSVSVASPLR